MTASDSEYPADLPDTKAASTDGGNDAAERLRVSPATRVAVVFFVLASIVWILSRPYRPERLYRSMPEQSVLVMDHVDLADAWSRDLTNSLVRGVALAWGAPDPGKLGENQIARRIVRIFTGRLSVTGLVPFAGRLGLPAIVGASWVGGPRATLYRVLLRLRWVPGLGRLGVSEEGTRYWRPPDDRDWPGAVISFEIFEGALLAAWSPNPDAVRGMVWRLDHGAPPSRIFGGTSPWSESPESFPHRAWLAEALTRQAGLAGIGGVAFSLVALDHGGATLRARIERSPNVYGRDTISTSVIPEFIPDNAPTLIASLSRYALGDLLDEFVSGAGLGAMLENASSGSEKPAWVWLTGAPYEGRLLGVRMPALFAAFPTERAPEREAVGAVLDLLNANWRLGLTHRVGNNRHEVLVDSSYLGFGGLRGSDAQCGLVTWRDGWRVAGSSSGAWRRQLNAEAPLPSRSRAAWRRWMERVGYDNTTVAALWADPKRLAGEVRHAVAVYRLGTLIAGGGGGGGAATEVLSIAARAGAVLEALGDFGALTIHVGQKPDGARLSLECRLGSHAADPVSDI